MVKLYGSAKLKVEKAVKKVKKAIKEKKEKKKKNKKQKKEESEDEDMGEEDDEGGAEIQVDQSPDAMDIVKEDAPELPVSCAMCSS